MNKTLLSILLVGVLIISPAAGYITHALQAGPSQSNHYKWVIMVYMDADNNLEDAAIGDINEMEVAGSTSEVAILVLVDRIPGYDSTNANWTGARIYLIKHDLDNQTINSQLLVDLGEVNMGDPETVLYFINYTMTNFPADHYMLDFWDHGSGWKRDTGSLPIKGCCWDYTDNDHLTEAELRDLMLTLASKGIHLDIVGFDACLMQMTEVAYDLMPAADIVVASEQFEPWDGWYYTGFLVPLITNPDMTPAQLAAKIVESYGDFYTNVEPLDYTTLSAVNLTAFEDVLYDLDMMAMLLTYDVYFYPENASAIKAARDSVQTFGSGDYIDLYGFAQAIADLSGLPYDPTPFAQSLVSDLENAVIANFAAAAVPGAHGISIYFPPNVDWYLEERYWYMDQVYFAFNSWWGWFLDYYFHTMKPTETLKLKVVTPPTVAPGSTATVYVLARYGNANIYVDSLLLSLVWPNGTEVPLEAERVKEGLYVANIDVPEVNVSTAFLVKATADYWFLMASDGAVLYASTELGEIPGISSSLHDIMGTLVAVQGDIVVIKTLAGQINMTVSELQPKIVDIENGIATITTKLGTIQATLNTLSPKIDKIIGDIAEITTTLGKVNVTLAELKPVIKDIQGNVVTISTTLGDLKGTIEDIQGNVATIKTDVGTLKVSLENLKTSQDQSFSSLQDQVNNLKEKVSEQDKKLNNTTILIIIVLIVELIIAAKVFSKK